MSVDTDDVKKVAAETAAGAEQNAASVLPDDVPAEVRTHWLDGTRSRELEAAEQELADDPETKLSSLDRDMLRAEAESPEEAELLIAGEESRLRKDKALEQAAKLLNQDDYRYVRLCCQGESGHRRLPPGLSVCGAASAETGRRAEKGQRDFPHQGS